MKKLLISLALLLCLAVSSFGHVMEKHSLKVEVCKKSREKIVVISTKTIPHVHTQYVNEYRLTCPERERYRVHPVIRHWEWHHKRHKARLHQNIL